MSEEKETQNAQEIINEAGKEKEYIDLGKEKEVENTVSGFPDLAFGEMSFPDFDLEMRGF